MGFQPYSYLGETHQVIGIIRLLLSALILMFKTHSFDLYRMCILDLSILLWYFYIFPLGNIIRVHPMLEVSRSALLAQL